MGWRDGGLRARVGSKRSELVSVSGPASYSHPALLANNSMSQISECQYHTSMLNPFSSESGSDLIKELKPAHFLEPTNKSHQHSPRQWPIIFNGQRLAIIIQDSLLPESSGRCQGTPTYYMQLLFRVP